MRDGIFNWYVHVVEQAFRSTRDQFQERPLLFRSDIYYVREVLLAKVLPLVTESVQFAKVRCYIKINVAQLTRTRVDCP